MAVDASKEGNILKANISFTPNDNTLVYGQWSEGFRLGRGQSVPPRDLCDTDNNGLLDFTGGRLIDELDPDTTENIELGAKFTLLDRRLTINSAVYRIDWEGLPARIDDTSDLCPRGIVQNNVGEARSEGAELGSELPSFNTNLQFNAWVAYNDA